MTANPLLLRNASKLAPAAPALAAAAAAFAMPAPALAQWQSVHRAPAANQVDRCSTAVLRAADNRPLRLAAGSSMDIEVLGHGIDLTREFEFDGGRVTWRGSHGGAANVARGCGAIGSVKLRLDVSRANPELGAPAERNFTLRIGGQAIRVTAILPARFQTFGWHSASLRQHGGALSTVQPQISGGGGSPPPQPSRVTRQSGPSCQETQTCGSATGMVFNPPPLPGGGTATDNEPLKSLAACILTKGGDIRLANNQLEIMLPDDRSAVRDCITAPSFAVTAQDYERADMLPGVLDLDPQSPLIRYSVSGGPEAVASASLDPLRAKFALNRDFALGMVGVRTFRLNAVNFAQRTLSLDVRVQSVIPYGVARLSPATVLASTGAISVGRFDSQRPANPATTVGFDVELAPSDAAVRPLRWEVRDAQGRPTATASCFAAGSGTLNPAAGAGRVSLSIPRVSGTACAGGSFSIWVAPQARLGDALYTETLPFTLR